MESSSGQQIALKVPIAKISETVGLRTVARRAQIPAAAIFFDVAPGICLNQATQAILPSTITPSFPGSAPAFPQSFNDLGLLWLVSILVIYLILGILYEDFIHPIAIISGLPAAGFGALLTLVVFDVELNVYSFIGIILLVGIVKKNGIMMVDFAIEAQRQEGKSPLDAICGACLRLDAPRKGDRKNGGKDGNFASRPGIGCRYTSPPPVGNCDRRPESCFPGIVTLYLRPVVFTYMEALRHKGGKTKQSQVFSRQKTKYLN